MRIIAMLSLLFLASPAFGELTKEDIRIIVREEVVASEKRTREYIDLKVEALNQRIDDVEKNLNDKIDSVNKNLNDKIDSMNKNLNDEIDNVNKSFDRVWLLILALIGLITAAIAIPQLIIAYREKGQKEMQIQIDQLRKELEAMQQ